MKIERGRGKKVKQKKKGIPSNSRQKLLQNH